MPKSHEVKRRVFPAHVTKIDTAQGIVEAIVNTFGILDDGNDIVVNGAFSKTISENGRRVKVVNSHNTFDVLNVIGKPLAMREVGRDELPEDIQKEWPEATGGLWTQTQYLIDTPEGLGAFKRIQADAVNEYSFMYEVMDADYQKVNWRGQNVSARILKQLKLYEYGPVVFGMNPATATTSAKSADDPEGKFMNLNQPRACMSDYMQARMRKTVNDSANYSLMSGNLTNSEHKALHAALDAAMDTFHKALPPDLAGAPMGNFGGFYYDRADDPDGAKTLSRIRNLRSKAGRALSGANADRIQSVLDALEEAAEELESLLEDAGVLNPENDEPDTNPAGDASSGKSQSGKAEPQAGPGAVKATPPTNDDERKRALEAIQSDMSKLEALR